MNMLELVILMFKSYVKSTITLHRGVGKVQSRKGESAEKSVPL